MLQLAVELFASHLCAAPASDPPELGLPRDLALSPVRLPPPHPPPPTTTTTAPSHPSP